MKLLLHVHTNPGCLGFESPPLFLSSVAAVLRYTAAKMRLHGVL